LELFKDYDRKIHYYPGKTNMVAGALSRKALQTLNTIIITQPCVLDGLERLSIGLIFQWKSKCIVISFRDEPSLIEEIKYHQKEDVEIFRELDNSEESKVTWFCGR